MNGPITMVERAQILTLERMAGVKLSDHEIEMLVVDLRGGRTPIHDALMFLARVKAADDDAARAAAAGNWAH